VQSIVRFAFALAIVTLLSCALFTSRVVTSSWLDEDADADAAAANVPAGHPHETSDGAVDLYGNEVIDAVATYSLDPAGSLYELHSPQTELPRLASPKS
jgi:hypothetical protein